MLLRHHLRQPAGVWSSRLALSPLPSPPLSVLQLWTVFSWAVCDHKLVSRFNCVSDNSVLNCEGNCPNQLSAPKLIILCEGCWLASSKVKSAPWECVSMRRQCVLTGSGYSRYRFPLVFKLFLPEKMPSVRNHSARNWGSKAGATGQQVSCGPVIHQDCVHQCPDAVLWKFLAPLQVNMMRFEFPV